MQIKISSQRKTVTVDFSDNLSKLSTYISCLARVGRIVPILNTTPEIFDIFKEWFEILDSIGIVDGLCDDSNQNVIFYPNFFIEDKKITDIETLLKLYDLGIYNQINLLSRTILFVISVLTGASTATFRLITFNDKVYVMDMSSKKFGSGELSCNCFETELSLTEFELVASYKDKVLYNYHPTLFDKYRFIYDFKTIPEKYIPKDVLIKIKEIKEDYLKNVSQYDSIYITPDITSFDNMILEEFNKLNEVISKNWLVYNVHSKFKASDINGCLNNIHLNREGIEKLITREKGSTYSTTGSVIELPESTKYIKSHAFEDLRFKKIILPYGLCFIGNSAFQDCGKFDVCYKDKKGNIHENEISEDTIVNNDAFKGCILTQEIKSQILKINPNSYGSGDEFQW